MSATEPVGVWVEWYVLAVALGIFAYATWNTGVVMGVLITFGMIVAVIVAVTVDHWRKQ